MPDITALSHLSVLYVEDEAVTREEMSRFLKRRVAHLSVASNGIEGLHAFEADVPDVLITDLRMPDMDGLELTLRIRKLEYETPIIITSALSDSETILAAVDREITKYIVKPIDAKELEQTLVAIGEKILARKQHTALAPVMSSERRLELEKSISRDFSALLKKATGKGPKRVKVKLSSSHCTILVDGTLTPMEQTLIRGAQSPEMIAVNRDLLYKTLYSALNTLFVTHMDLGIQQLTYTGHIREDREELKIIYAR